MAHRHLLATRLLATRRFGALGASLFGAVALAAAAIAAPQPAHAAADGHQCKPSYAFNRSTDTCHATGYGYLAYHAAAPAYPHHGYTNGAGSYRHGKTTGHTIAANHRGSDHL